MEQQTKRVALITGGSRGIGRAIALELARGGADIAVIYAGNEAAARGVVGEIEALGRAAAAFRCDVSQFDQARDTVAAVLETFGQVDILVNNAGITRDGLMINMKEEQFDTVVDTNLKGAFNMTRHVYGTMMKKRYGRIINVSSVVGLSGNAGQTNYASAKAGLIGLTKSVAKELAARGVTCNAVAPGFIETDMTDAMAPQSMEAVKAAIPLKRLGRAEDVAKLVAFLVSDSASYITGEVIKVDGGMYI